MIILKFVCNKKELYEATVNVSKAVSERSAIAVMEGIKLKLDNMTLELTGYDMEIGIRTYVSVKSEDKGEFILDVKLFAEMIKKMPEDSILIEVTDNMKVIISGGVTTYNLFAYSADEYPELPTKEEEQTFVISQPVLKSMINQTKFAVAVNDVKPIFKGELFEIENNMLTMVALDGYRLAIRHEPVKADDNFKFVVPAKTLSEITGLLSDNDDDSVKCYLSRKHIIFEIGNYMVYSRLLEGDFHPYKSALPKDSATEVVLDRKELILALERCQLLINERIPSPVKCNFDKNCLKLSCSAERGKIHDEISAEIEGPSIEIGFKCKFFLDPIKVIKDDKIKLQMNGSLLPMKIVPCEDSDYTYLILPQRFNKD